MAIINIVHHFPYKNQSEDKGLANRIERQLFIYIPLYLISCCIDLFQRRNSPKSDKDQIKSTIWLDHVW